MTVTQKPSRLFFLFFFAFHINSHLIPPIANCKGHGKFCQKSQITPDFPTIRSGHCYSLFVICPLCKTNTPTIIQGCFSGNSALTISKILCPRPHVKSKKPITESVLPVRKPGVPSAGSCGPDLSTYRTLHHEKIVSHRSGPV